MTRRIGKNALLIEVEEPQQCDWCGDIRELRPYGPNGEALCFPCAMKNPRDAERQFEKRLQPIQPEQGI